MQCRERAVLVITREVVGTSTNVASQRMELVCDKPKGHDGHHHDRGGEEWDAAPGKIPTLLRQEKPDLE